MIYTTKNFGVYYVLAGGDPNVPQWERKPDDWNFSHYAAACYCSIRALRETGYDGRVNILAGGFTPSNEMLSFFDSELSVFCKFFHSKGINGMQAGRLGKTQLIRATQREARVLYLDVDAIPLINPLSKNGLAHSGFRANQVVGAAFDRIAPNVNGHATPDEYQRTTRYLGGNFRQYNTGVLLIDNNERAQSFFDSWHQHWFRHRDIDQLAFLRARHDCAKQNITVHTLSHSANDYSHFIEEARKNKSHVWHPYGYAQESRNLFASAFPDFYDLAERLGSL